MTKLPEYLGRDTAVAMELEADLAVTTALQDRGEYHPDHNELVTHRLCNMAVARFLADQLTDSSMPLEDVKPSAGEPAYSKAMLQLALFEDRRRRLSESTLAGLALALMALRGTDVLTRDTLLAVSSGKSLYAAGGSHPSVAIVPAEASSEALLAMADAHARGEDWGAVYRAAVAAGQSQ